MNPLPQIPTKQSVPTSKDAYQVTTESQYQFLRYVASSNQQ